VLKSPILGKAVAKMVLQDVQGAVSERHASESSAHPFFSIYLDDFTEYLTPQFVSLLNKSRSANVGVVFAHQAIGDLEALGPEVKNQIMTNSNLKVFKRTNEPDSAEYFSKIIGTRQTTKITKRQKQKLFGAEVTDDGSIREVEEFIFHPNFFKNKLGVGEAVLVLPHTRGAKSLEIKFTPRSDLPPVALAQFKKSAPEMLTTVPVSCNLKSASIASLAAKRV
jgi:type IV secretory pathway TraG/TraD family ATPase VirD4